MASPPDYLVTPDELPRYGVPSSFLDQFRVRTVEVRVEVGGALGTMQIVWRAKGEDEWSNTPIASDSAASWVVSIEEAYATLTLAAGTYVGNTTYTVSTAGGVVNGAGAYAGLTASRYDLRTTACSAATNEAFALMRDGVIPPLTAWGDDVRMHTAALVYEHLKFAKGFTAAGAGVGDENVILRAQNARRYFADIGSSGISPPGIVDSAPSADGPIMHYPTEGDSTNLRGW